MSDPTDAVNVILVVLLSISLGINLLAGLWCDKVGQENKQLRARARFMQCLIEDLRAEMGIT